MGKHTSNFPWNWMGSDCNLKRETAPVSIDENEIHTFSKVHYEIESEDVDELDGLLTSNLTSFIIIRLIIIFSHKSAELMVNHRSHGVLMEGVIRITGPFRFHLRVTDDNV